MQVGNCVSRLQVPSGHSNWVWPHEFLEGQRSFFFNLLYSTLLYPLPYRNQNQKISSHTVQVQPIELDEEKN